MQSKANQMQSRTNQIQSKANQIQSKTNQIQFKTNQIQFKANQIQSKANQLQSKINQLQSKEISSESPANKERFQCQYPVYGNQSSRFNGRISDATRNYFPHFQINDSKSFNNCNLFS